MASFTSKTRYAFDASSAFELALDRYAAGADEIAQKAIYAGAEVIADEIKAEMDKIPIEEGRYLKNGDKFASATKTQVDDLKESFGITPMAEDAIGWNTKLGFDGYGSIPTKKYPKGVPNQLTARAIESGSSIRIKFPFVRRCVTRKKKVAIAKMAQIVDAETAKVFKK